MRHLAPVLRLVFGSLLITSLLVGCGSPTATPPLAVASPTANLVSPTSTTIPAPIFTPVPATPTPQVTPTLDNRPIHNGLLKEIFPVLGQLAGVTTNIHIETGLSDMSLSSDLDYRLKLDNSGLNGLALFEAYFYGGKIHTFQDARQISVPFAATNRFLEKLAETPLEEAPYKEQPITGTDYYPYFTFELETNSGELRVSTSAQTKDFTPWRVTFAGRNFYANNGLPFDAYNIIKPFLKTEVIDEMSKQFGQSRDQGWNLDPHNKSPQPVLPLKQLKESKINVQDGRTAVSYSAATDRLAVATGNYGNIIKLYNSSFELVQNPEIQSDQYVMQLVFSPDGKYLAGAYSIADFTGNDSSIWVWEVASGQLVKRLPGHPRIAALAFSQDDKTLVSASADRTVRVWSLPDGKNTLTLQAAFPEIYGFWAVAISPDGSKIAAGGLGNVSTRQFPIKVWDLKNNQAETTLRGHAAPLSLLSFSPDGKTLLSGDAAGELRLWKTANWQQLAETIEHGTPSVTNATYSPDGKQIAAAYQDGGLRVWDTSNLKLLSLTMVDPPTKDARWSLFRAFFAAGGQSILTYNQSGSESLQFRLWSVN